MSPSQDPKAWRETLSALDWDSDLICISDARDGRIEMASAGLQRWSGWELAELQGQKLGDLIHPEDHGLLNGRGAQVLRFRLSSGDWQRLQWQGLDDQGQSGVQGRSLARAVPIAKGEPPGEGVILFDEDDRVTFADGPIRAVMQDQGIPVGTSFAELMQNALANGRIPEAVGQEEAWLAEFIASRAACDHFSRDTLYLGDRWIRASDRKIAGGRLGLRIDVTELYHRKDALESIVAGAEIGTWDHDFSSGLSTCNLGFAAKLGLRLEELSPFTLERLSTFVHPEDLPGLQAARIRHVAGESPNLDAELRLRQADGSWAWFRSRGKIVERDSAGRPLRASGVLVDLDEVKETQARLRHSEWLLAKTGEAAGVGGFALDLATLTLTLTPQMRAIRGLPPDAAPDFETVVQAYAPASRAILHKAVQAARETGQGFDIELELIRPDGPIWVRAMGSVDWQDGRPARLYGAIQDISERLDRQKRLDAKRQRLTLATEGGGIGIWAVDLETLKTTWDRQMYRIYGRDPEAAEDASALFAQALHPEDQAATYAKVATALAGPARLDAEFRILWPDGSIRHVHVVADPVTDPQSRRPILLGVNWDVTPLRQLAADLAAQSDLLRVTLRSIGDAVITTDDAGRITWANPVAEALTGWPLAEAMGQPLTEVFVIHNEVTGMVTPDPVQIALREKRIVALEGGARLTSRQGRRYGIEDSAAPIRDDHGRIRGAVLVFHDVTEARIARAALIRRATHDSLTGIQSRSEFDIQLRQVWAQAQAGDGVHSLLCIDLDQFKRINDSCGHAAGDQVLREVAGLMGGVIRSGDLLARLGGDEFGIILFHCPPERGAMVGRDLLDLLEAYRFVSDGQAFRIGASIGLAGINAHWPAPEDILHAADAACMTAKSKGGHRVRLWTEAGRRPNDPGSGPALTDRPAATSRRRSPSP